MKHNIGRYARGIGGKRREMKLSESLGLKHKPNGYMEALDCKQSEATFSIYWTQEMIDGYNQALDEIDSMRLSDKKMAKVIQEAGKEWEGFNDPIRPLYVYIAQALISRQAEIFERIEK